MLREKQTICQRTTEGKVCPWSAEKLAVLVALSEDHRSTEGMELVSKEGSCGIGMGLPLNWGQDTLHFCSHLHALDISPGTEHSLDLGKLHHWRRGHIFTCISLLASFCCHTQLLWLSRIYVWCFTTSYMFLSLPAEILLNRHLPFNSTWPPIQIHP